jgi:DnaJ-class molecular chaperone
MNKLIECPNCIGTGDDFVNGKYPRKCRTCKGEGVVHADTVSNYIEEHLYDTLL